MLLYFFQQYLSLAELECPPYNMIDMVRDMFIIKAIVIAWDLDSF